MKDLLHDLGTLRIDGYYPIRHIVSQQRASKHHPLLHLSCLSPFDPLRGFAALLLSQGGHKRQPQLSLLLSGVDVVNEEKDTDSISAQFPGIGQGVQRVPGKPADLLGEDQIQLSRPGCGDHGIELGALSGAGAGDPLVRIDILERPLWIALDIRLEVPLLTFKGIRLVLLVGGHPAIGCHTNDSNPLPLLEQ